MAALSNARHERFAQNLAKGMTGDEAYQQAGYNPNRNNASRLKANENIQQRVRELQDVGAQRAEMTFEGHLRKLEELRDAAADSGQHSAAIQAEQLRGKANGYYVERHEVEQHTTVSSEPLEADAAEWERDFGDSAGDEGPIH